MKKKRKPTKKKTNRAFKRANKLCPEICGDKPTEINTSVAVGIKITQADLDAIAATKDRARAQLETHVARQENKARSEKKGVVGIHKKPSRKKPTSAKEPSPAIAGELAFTPEETRQIWAVYNRARYGAESQSPLFWVLEKLHGPYGETYDYLHMHGVRGINASTEPDNYVDALYRAWKDEQELDGFPADFESLPPSLFYDWATIAVRRRDAGFFKEVARLLEDKIKPQKEDLAARFAIMAYGEFRELGKDPTKRDVRERAIAIWKWWNVIPKWERRWNEEMPPKWQLVLEKIPKQNWTRVFKRIGLSHLRSSKGGQPSHKKGPLPLYCQQTTPNQCRQ
jgi:hypothetical protein